MGRLRFRNFVPSSVNRNLLRRLGNRALVHRSDHAARSPCYRPAASLPGAQPGERPKVRSRAHTSAKGASGHGPGGSKKAGAYVTKGSFEPILACQRRVRLGGFLGNADLQFCGLMASVWTCFKRSNRTSANRYPPPPDRPLSQRKAPEGGPSKVAGSAVIRRCFSHGCYLQGGRVLASRWQ